MNSHEIYSCLKQDTVTTHSFRGVFPKDMLLTQAKVLQNKNNSYVCNTAPKINSGEHWIAMYIDGELNGEYFDSYALEPNETFAAFLNQHCIYWRRNIFPLQVPFTSVCGQHCIFWLHSRDLGYSSECILNTLSKTNADKTVLDFVNKHYSGITKGKLVDQQFVIQQISKTMNSM